MSIMIPNYNYGRYLDECIQSALSQTYDNVEIVVLDNNSDDNSRAIVRKYPGVRLCKNGLNVMNISYKILSDLLCTGDYGMLLCSDDAIESTFVERAIDIMEAHPGIGYVHGERSFVEENGTEHLLSPFFKCSFWASGRSVMPIYMVTTIAHPSQGIFRMNSFRQMRGYDIEIDHMNADRSLWYYLSYENDYAYIREKMARIRVGGGTDTATVRNNFQHPILYHMTIKDYVRFARQFGLTEVCNREKEAYDRLAMEYLGYAAGVLLAGDYLTTEDYLEYSYLLNRDVINEEKYQVLRRMVNEKQINKDTLREFVSMRYDKIRDYDPPAGYYDL